MYENTSNSSLNVLITGAGGFLGFKVMEAFLDGGFKNIRCMTKTKKSYQKLVEYKKNKNIKKLEVVEGNLALRTDAENAVQDIDIIINCAAGKSGPMASMFLNTVISTRNILDACLRNKKVKRIVHISSFSVYETATLRRNDVVSEKTMLERNTKKRNDGYSYVKLKQENVIEEYIKKYKLPVVIVRPGVVYGPGGDEISRRVGLKLFGVFLNLGGRNMLPLSYVENCADAIFLASIVPNIEGETFNIHDNELVTCNEFLKQYRKKVKKIKTVRVPYFVFLIFSLFIEKYSKWSGGQIPAVFNMYKTASIWGKRRFDNKKLLKLLDWKQKVSTKNGLCLHFKYFRENLNQ